MKPTLWPRVLAVALCLWACASSANLADSDVEARKCGFDEVMQREVDLGARSFKEREGDFEKAVRYARQVSRYLRGDAPNFDSPPTDLDVQELELAFPITIRCIVHVLHQGEPEGTGSNMPRSRVESQIAVLNEDFRRKAGTPGFNNHPNGTDAMIRFVLETETEHRGVHRVDAAARGWGGSLALPFIESVVKPATSINPRRFFNVWVLNLGVFLGYGQYPDVVEDGFAATDGIVIGTNYFGRPSPGAPYNLGRTATHEVGHWLGLLHPWGPFDTDPLCVFDDGCADTPATAFPIYGCPMPAPLAHCVPLPAMIENYMEYTQDSCMRIFTKCQGQRMQMWAQIGNRRRSTVVLPADRFHVVSRLTYPPAQRTPVCPGRTMLGVDVINDSWNAIDQVRLLVRVDALLAFNATREATLTDMGDAAHFEVPLEEHVANQVGPGEAIVTMEATAYGQQSNQSATTRKQYLLNVIFPDGRGSDASVRELADDFDYPPAEFDTRWYELAPSGADLWKLRTNSSYAPMIVDGVPIDRPGLHNSAAYADNYAVDLRGHRVPLLHLSPPSFLICEDPPANLTDDGVAMDITFNYAYAVFSDPSFGVLEDGLSVELRQLCGDNRLILWQKYGHGLATAMPRSSAFVPLSGADWASERLQVSNGALRDFLASNDGDDVHVAVAFVSLNGYGNNVYVDDVAIRLV